MSETREVIGHEEKFIELSRQEPPKSPWFCIPLFYLINPLIALKEDLRASDQGLLMGIPGKDSGVEEMDVGKESNQKGGWERGGGV